MRAATTLSAITWREAQAMVASQKHWAVCPHGFLAPGGRLLESAARKASPLRRNVVIWMAYLWGVIGLVGALAHSGLSRFGMDLPGRASRGHGEKLEESSELPPYR